MQEKFRLFKCELCGHTSPSLHGIKVHIGHIHKGLKKPGVLVEDESSNLVNVETVGNTESELGDTSAINLIPTKKLQQSLRCSLCRKTFPNDKEFEEHKYTMYRDNSGKCPLCAWDESEACSDTMEHIEDDHKRNFNWIAKEYN